MLIGLKTFYSVEKNEKENSLSKCRVLKNMCAVDNEKVPMESMAANVSSIII